MSSSLRSHFRSKDSHRTPTASARHKQHEEQQNTRAAQAPPTNETSKLRQPSKLAKRVSRHPTPPTSATTHSVMPLSQSEPRMYSGSTASNTAAQISAHSPVAVTQRNLMQQTLSPPPTLRTPSLISGSSASTFDSPRSNVLRRKPSTIERFVARKRSEALGIELDRSTMHSRTDGYNEAMDDAVFGISMPAIGLTSSYPDYVVSAASTSSPIVDHLQYTNGRPGPTPSLTSHTGQSLPMRSASAKGPTSIPTNGGGIQSSRVADQRPVITKAHADSPATATRRLSSQLPTQSKRTSQTSLKSPVAATEPPARATIRAESSLPRSSTNSTKRTSALKPPELAHLDKDVLTTHTTTKSVPRRPTRDGTPELSQLSGPSPVIQSDMSTLPQAQHKRNSSRESFASVSSQSLRSRFGMSPRLMSKLSSPPMRSLPSPAPSQSDEGSLVKVASNTSLSSAQPGHTPTSATAEPSKSSRFAFLTRKPKVELIKPTEKPKREPRKGPAAGTGHERYSTLR